MAKRDLLDFGTSSNSIQNRFIFLKDEHDSIDDNKNSTKIVPHPLFCLKLLNNSQTKIFVNFCTSTSVPKPKSTDEHEILSGIAKNDESACVPICVGPLHKEKDLEGNECHVFDLTVNPVLKMLSTEVGRGAKACPSMHIWTNIIENLIIDGLKNKCSTPIDSTSTLKRLKNRVVYGVPVNVEVGPFKPRLIEEISSNYILTTSESNIKTDIFSGLCWKHVSAIPPYDSAIFFTFDSFNEIYETNLKLFLTSMSLKLTFTNQNNITSNVRLNLPCTIDPSSSEAIFSKSKKELLIKMKKSKTPLII